MKFLVIGDDTPFRDATCLLIGEEGHHVEPSAAGELALARLKEEEFDGVLLDLNPGRENGLDILANVLKQNPNQAVIMLTAQETVKTAVEAMRAGALDFLEKPFTREQFHSVAARLQRFQKLSEPSLHAGSLISIAKLEESHVRKILERSSSMVEAASILGIDQATLYRKRKKIGLPLKRVPQICN